MIVCKFGGSATTKTETVTNVKRLANTLERKVFVFSALGKDENNPKLTDLLIKLHHAKNKDAMFEKFFARIKNLCKLVNIPIPEKELVKIKTTYLKTNNSAYLLSRGEFLTALIMAKYLNLPFVPAERFMFFCKNKLDEQKTQKRLKQLLTKYGRIVVPGFYGIDENKKIVLFSRGGSDTTGAIISKSLQAETYENFTDVDGVFEINPNLCPSKLIKSTNYETLNFITNFDAKIINHKCAEILKNTLTTLKIKNIFNLSSHGTVVKKSCQAKTNFIVFKKIKNKYMIIKKDGDMFYLTFCHLNQLKRKVLKLKTNFCVH